MRRPDQRRLEAALARLVAAGAAPSPPGSPDMDELLDRLEAAADSAAARIDECETQVGQLRAALSRVAETVVICDADGRQVYRNDNYASDDSNRAGDVLTDQAVTDLLHEARKGAYPERILELFAPTRRNLSIRAFPLLGLERPTGAVAIIEDVSEKHRLDVIRRDFVANVSHELKTPVGALSLLAETLDGEDDPDVVANLSARLGTEAERLSRIIDDLLDLSRIEANESPAFDEVPMAAIIAEAMEPLRRVAEARGTSIVVVDSDPFLSVMCDRRDLVSAVSNLIDNAIKYSEADSKIEVRVSTEPGWVDVAVTDQGIGIPARDLERIFERFYRIDRARSRSTGGTGLGLSIVRHVAVNHGGSVSVRSTEGEGSTFTLRLPSRIVAEVTSG